jgi:CRP-like cAMP-binding protein
MRKEQRIGELELFGACRPDELRWIARAADQVEVGAGKALIAEGSRAREFIVVMEGVAASDDGMAFTKGAHFGHIELIGDDVHEATVTALTDMRILVFGPGAFRGLLERAPSVARKLMRELVALLRAPDDVTIEAPTRLSA